MHKTSTTSWIQNYKALVLHQPRNTSQFGWCFNNYLDGNLNLHWFMAILKTCGTPFIIPSLNWNIYPSTASQSFISASNRVAVLKWLPSSNQNYFRCYDNSYDYCYYRQLFCAHWWSAMAQMHSCGKTSKHSFTWIHSMTLHWDNRTLTTDMVHCNKR